MTSPADEGADPRQRAATWSIFAFTWAAAVLFHLAGNPRLAPEWGRGVLGAAAVLLLTRPRDPRAAVPLCLAVLVNVWLEAPLLSNHFLLHGFVAVIVLVAALTSRSSGGAAMARSVGPLRLTLLAFYAFAAFAKLNGDFFDPAVSCANFYLDESAGSWGLDGLFDGWARWMLRGVAASVALIELAVPVLLVVRRTRAVGVLVALAFHFLLAIDRSHQFFDFSSVLLALFLLFLPPEVHGWIVARVGDARDRLARRWESGPEILRLVALAAAALVVVVAAGPGDWPAPRVLRNVGVVVWFAYGIGVLVVVATAVRRLRPVAGRLTGHSTPTLVWIVPALAFANGLTPYLELKSAASWNMYANLAVVDGESNHFLVRSGLPLTDAHERLVDVESATGVDLGFYIDRDWHLPEQMLLDHIARHPGSVVSGTVDGSPVEYRGDEARGRATWRQKFQVFRAVDGAGPVSCQPGFGPAR